MKAATKPVGTLLADDATICAMVGEFPRQRHRWFMTVNGMRQADASRTTGRDGFALIRSRKVMRLPYPRLARSCRIASRASLPRNVAVRFLIRRSCFIADLRFWLTLGMLFLMRSWKLPAVCPDRRSLVKALCEDAN